MTPNHQIGNSWRAFKHITTDPHRPCRGTSPCRGRQEGVGQNTRTADAGRGSLTKGGEEKSPYLPTVAHPAGDCWTGNVRLPYSSRAAVTASPKSDDPYFDKRPKLSLSYLPFHPLQG